MSLAELSQDQSQFMTFYIGKDLYGIEVMKVQEVTGHLPVQMVPLAPQFVRGLINLRGQIATALDLRSLFGLKHQSEKNDNSVSVVCKLDGNLVSLLVDSLGDVISADQGCREPVPETVSPSVKKYLKGICKQERKLLSVIDLNTLSEELSLENNLLGNKE